MVIFCETYSGYYTPLKNGYLMSHDIMQLMPFFLVVKKNYTKS